MGPVRGGLGMQSSSNLDTESQFGTLSTLNTNLERQQQITSYVEELREEVMSTVNKLGRQLAQLAELIGSECNKQVEERVL